MVRDYLNKVADVFIKQTADDGYNSTPSADGAWVPYTGITQGPVLCRVTTVSRRFSVQLAANTDIDVSTKLLVTEYRTDLSERLRFMVDGQAYDSLDMDDPELEHHHLEFIVRKAN